MITATANEHDRVVFSKYREGWHNQYPLLALYIAASVDESGGVPMVPEELYASEEEAQEAEKQLEIYGAKVVRIMGYWELIPAGTDELKAHEIGYRYY